MNKRGFGLITLIVVAAVALVAGAILSSQVLSAVEDNVGLSPSNIDKINANECTRDGTCEVNSALLKACNDAVDGKIIVKAVEESILGDGVILVERNRVFKGKNLIVPGHLLEVSEIINKSDGFSNDRVRFKDLINEDIYEAVLTSEGVGKVTIERNIYSINYFGASSDPPESRYVILDYPQTNNENDNMDLSLCF